jgi:hypothetical protein
MEIRETGGSEFRAFEVLNLGRYERQAFLNVSGRLSAQQREHALAQKQKEFRTDSLQIASHLIAVLCVVYHHK